jgi:hypothetical protein
MLLAIVQGDDRQNGSEVYQDFDTSNVGVLGDVLENVHPSRGVVLSQALLRFRRPTK